MRSGERLMWAAGYFSFAFSSAYMQLLQIPRFEFSLTLFHPGGRRIVDERAAPLGGE
jgi:hypothetical protein